VLWVCELFVVLFRRFLIGFEGVCLFGVSVGFFFFLFVV